MVGILSRKETSCRLERIFHEGLIKLSSDKSKQCLVRYLKNEVTKHMRMKEKDTDHKIVLPRLYFRTGTNECLICFADGKLNQ
jgi:hypothetical protein